MSYDIHYDMIIKTTHYSGNFNREMCAYLIGMIGDGVVGEEFVKEFHESNHPQSILDEIEDINISIEDREEEGSEYCLPVHMTEGDINAISIHFEILPSKELIDFIMDRAMKFTQHKEFQADNYIGFKVLGYYFTKVTITRNKTTYLEERI